MTVSDSCVRTRIMRPTFTYIPATAQKHYLTGFSLRYGMSNVTVRSACSTLIIIDLAWEVVAAAGKSNAIEIFLNFMVMDMNMNVLLRDPEKAVPVQVARMNRFWGDATWRDAAYETNPQASFFQENEIEKANDANEKIAAAYRNRLLQAAGFAYVPEPLALKNKLGKTIYYLFFASPNKTGQKIVEHIFNKHRK